VIETRETSGRRLRLAAWVLVAIAALAAPLALRAGMPEPAAAGWSLALLTVMGWLLVTTPEDAIRLPWWASAACVAGGAFWLVGSAGAPWERAALFAGPAVMAGLTWLFSQTTEGRRWPGSTSVQPLGSTFWWLALWAWHPLIWLPEAGGDWKGLLGGALAVGALLTARGERWIRPAGVIVWAGSVVVSLLVV
jgi:hypothetical protein